MSCILKPFPESSQNQEDSEPPEFLAYAMVSGIKEEHFSAAKSCR
jgi:hypothetical protein